MAKKEEQPKMVTLTDGSEKDELVVRQTMRKIRTLCHYNNTAARELVRVVRKSGHRPPSRASWATFREIGLLTQDGRLDVTVQQVVMCAFEGIPIPRDPEAVFKPRSPIMYVVHDDDGGK